MDKPELRRYYRRVRDGIPLRLREEKSARLAARFLALPEYAAAGAVLCYVSFGSEAGTRQILKRVLADGKRLAVPLCESGTHTIRPCLIRSLEELTPGHYGILEPDPARMERGEIPSLSKSEISLCAVPALAFDREGYRLGYGGGYYDRFLEAFDGWSVGLAFSECVCDRLPRGPFDLRTGRVLTE